MTLVVTASDVRNMIGVDANAAQWSDASVNAHIAAAQDELEHSTGRWFVDRPATTFTVTTNGRAQVYVPGFRTISGVTLAGSAMVSGQSFYAIPDLLQTGVYTAIQLRPFTAHSRSGGPWWLHLGGAGTSWFDTNADSPYDPRNYGGGAEVSLPADLVVTGDGGFATASLPGQFLNAVKFLAAFYASRTSALLADVAITPSGGVLNYAQFQAEANAFIKRWKIGEQAVSV